MTIALAGSTPSYFIGGKTFGASNAAQYVVEQIAEGWAHLRKSNSLGSGVDLAIEELRGVEEECKSVGWDGHRAAPVEQETVQQAERFLSASPLGMAAPSVSAEPDGHITFEWYKSPHRTLSVSVSPEGDLHYAALLGYRKKYGTEPFFGEIPLDILNLVRRVVSE